MPIKLDPKKKKQLMIVAVIGVGGAAAYILWKNKTSTASSTDTDDTDDTGDDTSGIDPATGVPYSEEEIDPSTGVPYADEMGAMSPMGTTAGMDGAYDPSTGAYTPGLGDATIGSLLGGGTSPSPGLTTGYATAPGQSYQAQPAVPENNSQWTTGALSDLTSLGYDPATTAAALGLYIAGQPLTQDQYDLVATALGLSGNPPSGAPTPTILHPAANANTPKNVTQATPEGSSAYTPASQPATQTKTTTRSSPALIRQVFRKPSQTTRPVNGTRR